ncbi:hypothetical protein SRHO_G00155640 [Serrasalmus rhombeus]
MIPVQRVQAQAQVWPGEPPPLLWMLPGLCPLASAAPPPPLLVASRAPPLLRAVSRWQLSSNSCEPFLPLVRAAEPVVTPFPLASVQWELPSRPPVLSFQPSAGVDLVPVFPPLYRTLLPPHYGKAWLEKRVPDYKVYLNNSLALETTWISPEEVGIFQRQEKPMLMTNQVAMSISRPTAASRNFHTLLLTPRRVSGRRENFLILYSLGLATDGLLSTSAFFIEGFYRSLLLFQAVLTSFCSPGFNPLSF